MNNTNFLRTAFSIETFSGCFYVYSKEKKKKAYITRERGKYFQMKEENRNISFKFYLQVLDLAKTEMQIQLCKY